VTGLMCFLSLVGVPWMAARGVGYRGLYVAGALIGAVVGFVVFGMADARPVNQSPEQLAGAAFMNAYFPAVGLWLWVTAFAMLIGAAIYRQPSGAQRPDRAGNSAGN